MTTPPNPPQGGQQPHPGQPPVYGTGYGGVQYPYPEGQQPPRQGDPGRYGETHIGGNPPGAAPYGSATPYDAGPYAYGGPSPAGLDHTDAAPRPRPGIMLLSLVLLVLSAAPFLLIGAALLVIPLSESDLPPGLLDSPQFAEAGITPDLLISFVRFVGGFFAVLSLLFVLFAVLAFTRRNWARILVAVMTVGFTLFALLGAFSGGAADPVGLAVILGPAVLALAGVAVMFTPEPRAWFAAPSRR